MKVKHTEKLNRYMKVFSLLEQIKTELDEIEFDRQELFDLFRTISDSQSLMLELYVSDPQGSKNMIASTFYHQEV